MAKRYWLETYGCQMNKAESNLLENELTAEAWKKAPTPEEADLVIINTCAVRKTAENRIWGRIGYYKALKENSPQTLALMGCMVERLKDEIPRRTPAVDLLIGTYQKNGLIPFLKDYEGRAGTQTAQTDSELVPAADEFLFGKQYGKETDFSVLVPIMNGCNNFCSYCIVPYVRGKEISRSKDDILTEIDYLDNKGVKEITLIGQNVNSYQERSDGSFRFPQLLETIASRVRNIRWVRFISSHPKDFSAELIGVIKNNDVICKHIHLPAQHGSDRILKAMNRRYTRWEYLKLVEKIRRELPQATITTDLLIGFPGETEEDLDWTIDLMNRVQYEDAYTYKYNAMEGTAAFDLPNSLPEELKQKRLARIIAIQREISKAQKARKTGRELEVLVENRSRKVDDELLARTEQNDMVILKGSEDLIGRFVKVKLLGIAGNTFKAEEI